MKPAQQTAPPSILVWDLPVRVFHWLLVFSFAGAYLTGESERWARVHVTLGYTVAALLLFRLVWGFTGTRTARFAHFVRSPSAAWRYLKSLWSRTPQHHVGHNPAGAWAILALLGLAAVVTFTGWMRLKGMGPGWLEDAHEAAANALLLLAGVHVLAVLVSGWVHGDRLIGAMVTGRKLGQEDQGIRGAWRPLGLLLLVCALGFWTWEWTHPPEPPPNAAVSPATQLQAQHNPAP